ncbi:hypothetical protein JNJ66_03090 [Candidatus Saccharibacteria bacterium]|nr:hypothetical protein [Candidatus Saccharibacteria bacterium]
MKRLATFIFCALLVVAAAFFASTAYANRLAETGGQRVPQIYSPNRLTLELWSAFKKNMVEEGTGRTIQKDLGGDSTASGQAMTMQRAVWMDDPKTFDASWQWTKDNLQTEEYHFSGSFGELVNGNYGIKSTETSAGADASVAYGLIMGSARWREGKYLWDARPVMVALWRDHVVEIDGKPVLVSDKEAGTLRPADFAPYMYRTFAKVDPSHDWAAVMENTYDLLVAAREDQPDKLLAAEYTLDTTGATPVLTSPEDDAAAIAQRDLALAYHLTLDSTWYKDARARELLASFKPLGGYWHKHQELVTGYRADGAADSVADVPANYGMLIGYFMTYDRAAADAIYQRKLLTLYNPDTQSWARELGYRDDTWAWLGIALYNDDLTNIGGLYE